MYFFGAFNADLFVLFQFIGMKSLIAHKLQMMRKYGLYRSKVNINTRKLEMTVEHYEVWRI